MYRKSDSFLAPVEAAETPAGEYELYPAFEIGDEIFSRIEVLAERIAAEKSVVIDGYEGVLWEKFIESLVREVISLTGSKSKIVHLPLPADDPQQRQPDISLARNMLDGWEPKIQLRDGLLKTIAYFEGVLSRGGIRR